MILNILVVGLLTSLRFLVIGTVFLIMRKMSYTPMAGRDFGIVDLKCRLEGAYGYTMIIFSILWNFCWTWDLVVSVKNPMVYSEKNHKYYYTFVYLVGLIVGGIAFGLSETHISEKGVICILNTGYFHYIFVIGPICVVILFNLYVNIKYGSDSFLKTFSKNYERFKQIFFYN